jgi:DNA-3-methyladenine glycosylase I
MRCFGSGKPFYEEYHDREWGVPVREDRKLFEMLVLEGAQAGLSWETVLKRREGYRRAFWGFDVKRVAEMSDGELEEVLREGDVVRNRLKVFGVRRNARVFLEIQEEFGSFAKYVWGFVGGVPIVTRRKSLREVPATSAESDRLAKDLKRRGMTFVGTTIMYAFMQAVGLVDDHLEGCLATV